MVKELERKKAYHPRAPHKDGCQCAACKSKRVKAEVAIPAPAPAPVAPAVPAPSIVLASSLKLYDKFEFNGQIYKAGMREEDFIWGMNVGQPGAAPLTLGFNAKVKLIK